MAVKKGIDISQYQGDIDFTKVKKSGIDFVIVSAGYGKYENQKEPYFEKNYKNAKAAGLDLGVYWYSYAQSVQEAKTEAQICMKAIKGKQFEYPVYFDLEEQSQFSKGKSFCDSIVKAFCTELEKSGYYAGLYISRSYLQTYISADVAKRYALWIAEYGGKCGYSGSYGMWQYSSAGKVSGISGNVDLDLCYTDYPAVIKKGGFNGYSKQSDQKVLDSSGYRKGDSNNGVLALKCLLMTAKKLGLTNQGVDCNGVFGDGTQLAVNGLLKSWGYSQNGIAGGNFIKRLKSEVEKKIE